MKPQPEPSSREVLAGLVERVTYHNDGNGYCVLRIKARGHRELVTVVGHAAVISAGEWITVPGDVLQTRGTDGARRHREIPRLRDDPRHRASLCQEAGARLR